MNGEASLVAAPFQLLSRVPVEKNAVDRGGFSALPESYRRRCLKGTNMWTTEDVGLAQWSEATSTLNVDARGGKHPITLSSAQINEGRPLLRLDAVDGPLPNASEQFTRQRSWHVNFPQEEQTYALRLAMKPIESTPTWLVMELTISLQTDLLDTHPTLDLDVDCHSIDSIVPSDPTGDDIVRASGSAPISIASSKSHSVSILLGPHDSPFTTNHSTDSRLRLRLFGDFLEKGVIRKARPWIVFGQRSPTEDQLTELWNQLCASPLPLA